MRYLKFALAAAMLLCLTNMPYGYYTLLRFVCAIAFGYMAYEYAAAEKKPLAVTFGGLALLFQPYIKVTLGRDMWNTVDLIVAILLIVLGIKEWKNFN